MQWSVVSLVGHSNVGTIEMPGRHYKALDDPANETGVPSARAALDRIVIPEDTIDRIAQMVSPRSSFIISDEGSSSETSRGTEFVIVMSDEPQGGLASRRRGPAIGVRYQSRRDRLSGIRWLEMHAFLLVAAAGSVIGRANWQAPGSFSPWLVDVHLQSSPNSRLRFGYSVSFGVVEGVIITSLNLPPP